MTVSPNKTKGSVRAKARAPSNSNRVTGAALERFRIEQNLTHSEGAEAFGVPIATWYDITGEQGAKVPVPDSAVALTKTLYTQYPESAPKQGRPDVRKFYEFLGLGSERRDKLFFAALIGRTPQSVYRLLDSHGKASRTLIRYIEGLQRLNLDPASTLEVMQEMAGEALCGEEGRESTQ